MVHFGRTSVSTGGETDGGVPGQDGRRAGRRRFPLAVQPEIMRAAEKDEHYTSYVYDACRDAFRHLFGTRTAVTFQNETKLLGQMLYYLLTTGSGQQTLGEEYCDLMQVASNSELTPTTARRILFIIYQTLVPYLAERISSRIISQGVILADSHSEGLYSLRAHTPASSGVSSSQSGETISRSSSLKGKLHSIWRWAIQKWPLVLPHVNSMSQLALRANLMLFYFEGLYYHISKRAAGIRYVFVGKQLNQRPRYQILGIFLLIQLCILGLENLRQSNLSSVASSVQQRSSGTIQTSEEQGFHLLSEDGALISDTKNSRVNGTSKCTLCLSSRQHPTATLCGHVFCWNCIMEWCNEKPECPLCRTPVTHPSLVCIYHSDF